MSYLGMNVYLYNVQPDGNCLYHALSHIIFGSEDHYELLKHKLIETFLASPHMHFNVMQISGILSGQELQEHVNMIFARNAWGTNVELSMLGALAGVDILVIDCTEANSTNWNIRPNYIHSLLEIPKQCEAIVEEKKLCVLHHRFKHLRGNEHFDSLYT